MTCNQLTKPEMTLEQIAECEKCKHASAKKIWCCLFGIPIKEKSLIIQSSKRVIQPIPKPTIPQMMEHFGKAMLKWSKSGFKTVDKETYIKRRQICSDCQPTGRCPHCGCNLFAKVALATETCPERKW
jgi:hypothetical protein